jgi:secondary thiamine-phosphate synthase enzyme
MHSILIQTKKLKEIIDLTDIVKNEAVKFGYTDGFCVLFLKHTTAALTTADLDMGTDLDMLDAFEAMIPKLHYRHPHDPAHVTNHIMSSIVGASLLIPLKKGALDLGSWQKIILVELDGPREREISIAFLKELI